MTYPHANEFIALVGKSAWRERVQTIAERTNKPTRSSKLAATQFMAECAIEKARRGLPLSTGEASFVNLATRLPMLHETLSASGKTRLSETLEAAMLGDATVIPLLHLMHTAELQNARGFEVAFTGLNDATPFDLLITRDGVAAEVACEPISAEDGRAVHRGAWTALVDRVDPDLQTWLAAHPGRYLLKMTLPQGLKSAPDAQDLPTLHARINNMLSTSLRSDYDEAAVLRLDPLLLAGAQAHDGRVHQAGMMAKLKREFGPEAYFSVTEANQSVFVMAARGSSENQIAGAVRQRMSAIAPARLTGERPGILAMMIDDTDQVEWKTLCDQLLLEGEARQFLTFQEARNVIAVTCASRFELAQIGASQGDLRFRNPMHPEAKSQALAPAVLSTF
ncbi:MAG: hypothetical protein POG24_01250 [Acidocella sp.]|nr:hypothetical protein [Acidocella sp.]